MPDTCVRNSLLSELSWECITYLLCVKWFVCLFTLEKSPVYGVLDSSLHTRLAIVTANELGLAFPPRNLPKKFCPDPSTFYFVIVVTDRQTDGQTYAGDSIIPRESFRGDNNFIWRTCVQNPRTLTSVVPEIWLGPVLAKLRLVTNRWSDRHAIAHTALA